jgi:hypothetical protein
MVHSPASAVVPCLLFYVKKPMLTAMPASPSLPPARMPHSDSVRPRPYTVNGRTPHSPYGTNIFFLGARGLWLYKNAVFLYKNVPFLTKNVPFLTKSNSFLTKNDPFLTKNDAFLTKNDLFLIKNISFLTKNVPFLIKNNSLLIKNTSFLTKNSSLLIKNTAFLIKNVSFLIKNVPFLTKNDPFLIKNASFLIKNTAFLIKNVPFLIKNTAFLIKNNPFLTKNVASLSSHTGRTPIVNHERFIFMGILTAAMRGERGVVMSFIRNWFPGTRVEQLAMGKNWAGILSVQGPAWNVPASETQALDAFVRAADAALTVAANEAARTPVATAQCRAAFGRMEAKMRDVKTRYFHQPPLTEADMAALGLKPHAKTRTPPKAPAAQAACETFLAGRRELGIRIVYVTGDPDDKANKGFRIWYAVIGAGEKAPETPEELGKSFYTQRKKEVIEFGYTESGKRAYFAIQIENKEKKGPWGPLTDALIP